MLGHIQGTPLRVMLYVEGGDRNSLDVLTDTPLGALPAEVHFQPTHRPTDRPTDRWTHRSTNHSGKERDCPNIHIHTYI